MFNAPNQAIITGRNTTMNLASPTDPDDDPNLPYDASGNLVAARSLPRDAGFGVANGYQTPRTVQVQIELLVYGRRARDVMLMVSRAVRQRLE